jgi:heme A synthase
MYQDGPTEEADIKFWTLLEVVSLFLVLMIGIATLFQWLNVLLGIALIAPVAIFFCAIVMGHKINQEDESSGL